MANTSTKNFPHAYGAGRCVAAFSLSHPGGPDEMGEDATDSSICQPPAFNMSPAEFDALPDYPDRSTSFAPYDPADPASLGDFTVGYTPDRQPYNATSFGVYCTGSGTKALPYRTALAPFVPQSVSPSLYAVLPGTSAGDNQVRPFNVVDQTRLGTTRAQYVARAKDPADPADNVEPSEEAWYEVGLDWVVPPIKFSLDTATMGGKTSWASDQVASVRNALASTFWITAQVGCTAISEAHPELDSGGLNAFLTQIPNNSALTTNPSPGAGWEAPYGEAISYGGDSSFFGTFGLITPFTSPSAVSPLPIQMYAPFEVRTDLVLKITSAKQKWTNSDSLGNVVGQSNYTVELKVAPVIRVWMPAPLLGGISPLPLGRSLVRPASSDDDAWAPPCINVQVWQKNSSATDGTLTPVYDLFGSWGDLGGGGS